MVFECAMSHCDNNNYLKNSTQASIFSFFLFFFRKEGVRNFFFFLDGDFDGEPSGERTSSIFSGDLMVISMFSMVVLVVNLLTRLASSSSTSCMSSLPFTTMTGTSMDMKLLENSSWFSRKQEGFRVIVQYWNASAMREGIIFTSVKIKFYFNELRIYYHEANSFKYIKGKNSLQPKIKNDMIPVSQYNFTVN